MAPNSPMFFHQGCTRCKQWSLRAHTLRQRWTAACKRPASTSPCPTAVFALEAILHQIFAVGHPPTNATHHDKIPRRVECCPPTRHSACFWRLHVLKFVEQAMQAARLGNASRLWPSCVDMRCEAWLLMLLAFQQGILYLETVWFGLYLNACILVTSNIVCGRWKFLFAAKGQVDPISFSIPRPPFDHKPRFPRPRLAFGCLLFIIVYPSWTSFWG